MDDVISYYIFVIMCPPLSVCALVFNAFAVYIFRWKFMLNSMSIILILNICFCDIFVSVFTNTLYVINISVYKFAWIMGNDMCKVYKFFVHVVNNVQIFSLTALNIDRYKRHTRTMVRQWDTKDAVKAIIAVWMMAGAVAVPDIYTYGEVTVAIRPRNITKIVSIYCGNSVENHSFVITTVFTFIIVYIVPSIIIVFTLCGSLLFWMKQKRKIHTISFSTTVLKMQHQLALTFNLTAMFHFLVWTPFYILSILDLQYTIGGTATFRDINFSLRCTVLLLGTFKPIIYFIGLNKFRTEFISIFRKRGSKIEPNRVSEIKTTRENLKAQSHSDSQHVVTERNGDVSTSNQDDNIQVISVPVAALL